MSAKNKSVIAALAMLVLFAIGAQTAVAARAEDDVLYMREEEKLARDAYLALYDLWQVPVFSNIAQSEQQHMDAMLSLVEAFDLVDPVQAPGLFTNPELQKLYDDLVARGSESLEEALLVGALIEEVDIVDLDKALSVTDDADSVRVYENLRAGSENHLRAFVSQLERLGTEYEPELLDSSEFESIASAGGRGRRGRNR